MEHLENTQEKVNQFHECYPLKERPRRLYHITGARLLEGGGSVMVPTPRQVDTTKQIKKVRFQDHPEIVVL